MASSNGDSRMKMIVVRHATKNKWDFRKLWFRAFLMDSINMMTIGTITMMVGHLTPPRQALLDSHNDVEVLDPSASAFNYRLELCRWIGLAVFCCGVVVLLAILILRAILRAKKNPSIPVAPLAKPFDTSPPATKMPITESIKPVQPITFPQSATE